MSLEFKWFFSVLDCMTCFLIIDYNISSKFIIICSILYLDASLQNLSVSVTFTNCTYSELDFKMSQRMDVGSGKDTRRIRQGSSLYGYWADLERIWEESWTGLATNQVKICIYWNLDCERNIWDLRWSLREIG